MQLPYVTEDLDMKISLWNSNVNKIWTKQPTTHTFTHFIPNSAFVYFNL